jgi:hypothetical protein
MFPENCIFAWCTMPIRLEVESGSGGAMPGATGVVAPARLLHYNEYLSCFKVTNVKCLCN